MDEFHVNRSVKKLRILTVALIFSGALNIGLIAAGIFSGETENGSHLSIRPQAHEKAHLETSMDRCFAQMESRSFHELVSYLTNRDPVDEGYLKRDLALASLVSFHHFNIEKAISGVSLQRREISLGEDCRVVLFPGLSNDHFEAIIRFAYEEKWPLSTEGIFKLLKKWPESRDQTLVQAFFVTPEFRALQALFQKTSKMPQTDLSLLNLVCEGPWDLLDQFAKQQAHLLDLSEENRRSLLLNYLAWMSKTAANLLLTTDFAFASKRLEDQGMIGLISLLREKTPEAVALCQDVLRSPRSDAVWAMAVGALYAYEGEVAPEPFDLQAAVSRFVPELAPQKEPEKPVVAAAVQLPKSDKLRHHIVKEGETLWKIARQYNMKVDELVKLNPMEKDRLYPGQTLKVKE